MLGADLAAWRADHQQQLLCPSPPGTVHGHRQAPQRLTRHHCPGRCSSAVVESRHPALDPSVELPGCPQRGHGPCPSVLVGPPASQSGSCQTGGGEAPATRPSTSTRATVLRVVEKRGPGAGRRPRPGGALHGVSPGLTPEAVRGCPREASSQSPGCWRPGEGSVGSACCPPPGGHAGLGRAAEGSQTGSLQGAGALSCTWSWFPGPEARVAVLGAAHLVPRPASSTWQRRAGQTWPAVPEHRAEEWGQVAGALLPPPPGSRLRSLAKWAWEGGNMAHPLQCCALWGWGPLIQPFSSPKTVLGHETVGASGAGARGQGEPQHLPLPMQLRPAVIKVLGNLRRE